jgi:hypothetical protein
MRPPSPDDPGRRGGTSHIHGRTGGIRVAPGEREQLRTVALRFAELDGLGIPRRCRRKRGSGERGHSKLIYATRVDASQAAIAMAPTLGFVQEVYQCKRHFHLTTGNAARQASLTRLHSRCTEREDEQP